MYDMKNLERLQALEAKTADAVKAFWAFDKAVFTEGALSVRQKQLIAVAVALTTQCPYCIALHNKSARDAGASDAELTEAAMVAAALGGRAAAAAGRTLDDLERSAIQASLERTGWNFGEACSILGISRPTLRRKIARYELRR